MQDSHTIVLLFVYNLYVLLLDSHTYFQIMILYIHIIEDYYGEFDLKMKFIAVKVQIKERLQIPSHYGLWEKIFLCILKANEIHTNQLAAVEDANYRIVCPLHS